MELVAVMVGGPFLFKTVKKIKVFLCPLNIYYNIIFKITNVLEKEFNLVR